jgi:hypothetical protein
MTAIGLREGTSMEKDKDQDKAAPAEQDPDNSSSPGNGATIPKSRDGVWATSTPGKSTFEPEEDVPAQDSGAEGGAGTAGGPAGGSEEKA